MSICDAEQAQSSIHIHMMAAAPCLCSGSLFWRTAPHAGMNLSRAACDARPSSDSSQSHRAASQGQLACVVQQGSPHGCTHSFAAAHGQLCQHLQPLHWHAPVSLEHNQLHPSRVQMTNMHTTANLSSSAYHGSICLNQSWRGINGLYSPWALFVFSSCLPGAQQ